LTLNLNLAPKTKYFIGFSKTWSSHWAVGLWAGGKAIVFLFGILNFGYCYLPALLNKS